MRRRRALVAASLAVAVATALATSGLGGRAWRTAYPHLPPRLQAVPYRLRALVRRPVTPVALPPPSAPGAQTGRSTSEPVRAADAATPGAGVPPTPGAGVPPTAGASVPPTAAASPTASPRPTVGAASLAGVRHAYQTWNNCGPATISMALSVLGLDEGQAKAAQRLKPDPDDKNVGLDELARYAAERGAGTTLRYGGRVDTLAALVAAGYPVIVETWFEPEPGDEMGHYRLVTGFDAARRALTMADSYLGPAITEPYERFDADWRAFDRALLVVHPPERAADVEAIVGAGGAAMWFGAAATAADEIRDGADAFGWFNLGTSLLGGGDGPGAVEAFDRARAIGLPWRMLWYQFGPFEAYAGADRWSDVQALAEANLANAPNLEESWYWLGRARAADGDLAGARAAWHRAADLNPLYAAPAGALAAADGSAP